MPGQGRRRNGLCQGVAMSLILYDLNQRWRTRTHECIILYCTPHSTIYVHSGCFYSQQKHCTKGRCTFLQYDVSKVSAEQIGCDLRDPRRSPVQT